MVFLGFEIVWDDVHSRAGGHSGQLRDGHHIVLWIEPLLQPGGDGGLAGAGTTRDADFEDLVRTLFGVERAEVPFEQFAEHAEPIFVGILIFGGRLF